MVAQCNVSQQTQHLHAKREAGTHFQKLHNSCRRTIPRSLRCARSDQHRTDTQQPDRRIPKRFPLPRLHASHYKSQIFQAAAANKKSRTAHARENKDKMGMGRIELLPGQIKKRDKATGSLRKTTRDRIVRHTRLLRKRRHYHHHHHHCVSIKKRTSGGLTGSSEKCHDDPKRLRGTEKKSL